MTILLCTLPSQIQKFKEKIERYNVTVIETTCPELEESMPLVIRIPENEFYQRVSVERIIDVIRGHAGDLKVQTARLFDVSMKKYISEPKYRQLVKDFRREVDTLEKWNSDTILKVIEQLSNGDKVKRLDLVNAVKMALIKTTKCPPLEVVMEAYGKKEFFERIQSYLVNYKYRY